MVHRHTQSIDIGTSICLTTSVLLRRTIAFRSKDRGICKTFFLIFSGNTKIENLQISLRFQHNIARFHIPINNWRILRMQIHQGVAQLHRPFHNHIFRLCAISFENLLQCFSFDVVHDNADRLIAVYDVYNSRKCRVIQSLHQIRFDL